MEAVASGTWRAAKTGRATNTDGEAAYARQKERTYPDVPRERRLGEIPRADRHVWGAWGGLSLHGLLAHGDASAVVVSTTYHGLSRPLPRPLVHTLLRMRLHMWWGVHYVCGLSIATSRTYSIMFSFPLKMSTSLPCFRSHQACQSSPNHSLHPLLIAGYH